MWALVQDDFEGLGSYFVGCWPNKPSLFEIKSAIKRPYSAIPFQEIRTSVVEAILSSGIGGQSCFCYTLEEFGETSG